MPSGDAAGLPARWRTLSRNEQPEKLPEGVDALVDAAMGRVSRLTPRRTRLLRRAERILDLEPKYQDLSDARLRESLAETRDRVRIGGRTPELVDHGFAMIREAARRELGLNPYREQVAAGLAMYAGHFVELATGEGKTLSATLPAVFAGWRGRGCHVITVNDYLAERDADLMRGVYRRCGLTVRHVDGQMKTPDRRAAYAADVTYATNKEVTADYLRDQLLLGRRRSLTRVLHGMMAGESGPAGSTVMRGLDTAIIDEADSVLIDEAVTPLIISGDAPNQDQTDAFAQAAEFAAQLKEGRDYKVLHRYREIRLTEMGRKQIAALCADESGIWTARRRREELIRQALSARELFHRDQQYVVDEEKIVIVDEFTGRLMPDRTWRAGLHQAVEAKEGLDIQPMKDTLARISFQRFFRQYSHLAGMTGTAWEARHELWQVYHRQVVRIPTHRPSQRRYLPDRLFMHQDDKWQAVRDHVVQVHGTGRPVLVGTRSVEASEKLSGMITAAGLVHQVLNAVRHKEEARIIAQAGQPGAITVATNMAGRGVDIKLGRGVHELGGLEVIATERHESLRIDRQLFGRCARQGDPGEAIVFASLEDELLQRHGGRWRAKLAHAVMRLRLPLAGRLVRRTIRAAQGKAERLALQQRKSVLKHDDWLDDQLGFTGSRT